MADNRKVTPYFKAREKVKKKDALYVTATKTMDETNYI